MMAESKPFASLSSGLLARKGGAKPAMRPQGLGSFGSHPEDLGWNDMGHIGTPEEHVPTPIHALTPSPTPRHAPEPSAAEPHAYEAEESEAHEYDVQEFEPPVAERAVPEPAVLEQQRALEASFPPSRPSAVVALPRRQPTVSPLPAKAKAAFTLRLDPERHLKLRVACALCHRSAQQLVTEALDEFLKSLPEVEALAERAPVEVGKRSR
jgi:hypothetical protein